jgi:hypothetical protein
MIHDWTHEHHDAIWNANVNNPEMVTQAIWDFFQDFLIGLARLPPVPVFEDLNTRRPNRLSPKKAFSMYVKTVYRKEWHKR